MAQHEEFDVFGGGRSGHQQDQSEHLPEDQVQQPQRHAGIMSDRRSSLVRAQVRLLAPHRVGRDAEDVDAAGGVLDNKERVEPVQGDRVDVEHVASQDRLSLRSKELRPGRTGPSGRGVDSGTVQDRPDRKGADSVAESGELAVHAPIPPGRIFGGQA